MRKILLGEDKDLFEKLGMYQTALKRSAHCYHDLKHLGTSESSPVFREGIAKDLQSLESSLVPERDLSALAVVEWVCAYDFEDRLSRLGEKLGICQEKLLRYAVQGEMRTLVRQWQSTEEMGTRLSLSSRIYTLIFGEEGQTPGKCFNSLRCLPKEIWCFWPKGPRFLIRGKV